MEKKLLYLFEGIIVALIVVIVLTFVNASTPNTWEKNLIINASLPDIGDTSVPSVFYKDSSWYLISGDYDGNFFGFLWDGSKWISNSTIIAGLPDVGIWSAPSVFYKDSSWYLISGEYDGKFFGYVWSGTNWVANSTIIASLPDIGYGSSPSVFYKDSSWYLISGDLYGDFYGFKWDGSKWISNSTIIASLPNIGYNSHPSVFQKDGKWYIIAGEEDGIFNGYVWSGTNWVANSTIIASLPNVGFYSKPFVFNKDGSLYLIDGSGDGKFYGYNYYIDNTPPAPDTTPPTYSQVSVNNTLAGQLTKFSININDNTALNPNGQYIFSTNNSGSWINDSAVLFLTTPSLVNITKILNLANGTIVGYTWYIADNAGNTISTPIYSLTTTVPQPPAPDTTPPTYSQISFNNTFAGQATKFSVSVNDNLALNPNGQYIFSTNNSGSWINDSAVLFSTTPSWANVTKTLNSNSGVIVGYRWYITDNAGNAISTPIYSLTTIDMPPAPDTIPPTYSQVSVNNTLAGQITNFAINVNDNLALNPNGQYIFSTNNGGQDNSGQGWLNFDGINDYVSLGDKPEFSPVDNNDVATFSVWFKINSDFSDKMYLFSKNSPYEYELSCLNNASSRQCLFYYWKSDGSESNVLTVAPYTFGKWHNIVIVLDKTKETIYFDGVYIDSTSSNYADVSGNAPLLLGKGATSGFLNGSLDNFMMINGALNAGQVNSLYYKYNNLYGDDTVFIPVLMYHDIDNGGNGYTTVSQFAEQLAYLNSSGYKTITDIEYYNWTQNQGFVMPAKPIMFIFDDGPPSNINVAAPMMAVYGYKGVAALTTTLLGGAGLTWANVNTLIYTYNWSIASHSSVHCNMVGDYGIENTCRDSVTRRGNLSQSKSDIIANTGFTPITFIYPYNGWNSTSMSDCLLNYTLCFGTASEYQNPRYITKYSNFSNGDLWRISLDSSTITLSQYDSVLSRNLNFDTLVQLKFDENSSTTAYDSSGKGNNGIISGATWKGYEGWINDSAVNFITTSSWANVTKTLVAEVGKLINYRWYIADNVGNTVSTPIYSLTTIGMPPTPDTTPPTYSQVSVNNTLAGQSTKFSININDNVALNPNGQYIFSTNNSGSWVNNSAVLFSTTPSSANVAKILNSTNGTIVGYMWYITDNAGNAISTPIYTLITTALPIPDLNLKIMTPNIENPLNVVGGNNYPIYFNFTKDNVSLTSGVTLDSVFIGGINAKIYSDPIVTKSVYYNARAVQQNITNTAGAQPTTWANGFKTMSVSPNSSIAFSDNVNWTQLDGATTDVDLLSTYNFTISEPLNTITSIEIWIIAGANSSGSAEDIRVEIANFTSKTWVAIGSDFRARKAVTAIYTNATISNIIQGGQLMLALQGLNMDNGEAIKVDYVQIRVNSSTGTGKQNLTYINNVGWNVNITAPDELTGLQDLFINASYDGNLRNDTQIKAINYSVFTPIDNCVYSGSGNWNILFSDYCNITSNVIGDGSNITISGMGTLTIDANISGFKNEIIYGPAGQSQIIQCSNGNCFK